MKSLAAGTKSQWHLVAFSLARVFARSGGTTAMTTAGNFNVEWRPADAARE